jgi:Domain of unknown function (DUF4440)
MSSLARRAVALALLTLSTSAGAAEPAAGQQDPMAGWAPPKVKAEAKDKKEIQDLFLKMEAAGKKGDLDGAAAVIDFPVLMVTDDKKGEAAGETWTRAQWEQVMKPFYAKPMEATMKHEPAIFLVTDSLATANVKWTMKERGKTMTGRNALILIRKGGEWKVKAMMEGGWGDMPMAAEAPAAK